MPLARAFVPWDILTQIFLTGQSVRCVEPLSAEASLRDIVPDGARGGVWIILDAATFPPAPPGGLLPELSVILTAS